MQLTYKRTLGLLVILAALLVASVVAVMLSTSVSAATRSVHGNDFAYHSGNGWTITACDGERDGHEVRAVYSTRYISSWISDENGAAPGCTSFNTQGRITSYRVQEVGVGWGNAVRVS